MTIEDIIEEVKGYWKGEPTNQHRLVIMIYTLAKEVQALKNKDDRRKE